MPTDLHTHSAYSDGSESPAQVVELAVAAGLTSMALTDHDCLDGLDEAAQAAAGRIDLIPGVELSVTWGGGNLHLLAYWVSPGTPLAASLDGLRQSRVERNREIIDALIGLGIDISLDDVLAEAGEGVVGRPHIAAVLVRIGAVRSMPEAFDLYLASGRPAYRGRRRLPLTDAVDLARRSGAVAVVAHPHTLADRSDQFAAIFTDLAAAGIDGIECYYSEYSPELRSRLADLAGSLDLVPTGGSDFHGTYKEGIRVGVGRGDLVVPDECVTTLRARRPRQR